MIQILINYDKIIKGIFKIQISNNNILLQLSQNTEM